MKEQECYKKIYGDLVYYVEHYHPKRELTMLGLYLSLLEVNKYINKILED